MSSQVDIKIDILNDSSCKILPLRKSAIRRCIIEVLRAAGMDIPKCEISLYFVDDDEMRRLNCEFRSINRTTDVLSFPQFSSRDEIEPAPSGDVLLGDVVISLQALYRRSSTRGDEPSHEMARLLAHGVLHLIGYDHRTQRGRRRMRGIEERVIDTLSY